MKKPTDITSFTYYAVCPHFDSEFCQLATTHFHILLDSIIELNEAMKQIKTYAVPCLFTHLFSTSTKLETNGDVFSKLKLAIEYKNKAGEKLDSVTVRKRLPIFPSTAAPAKNSLTKATVYETSKTGGQKTIHDVISLSAVKETQTEKLCTETLKTVEQILRGPHSSAFCQVMDIFVNGYGKLDIDSELLSVRLEFEEIKFLKNIFYLTDINTSYEAQSEAVEHH